MNLGPQMSKIRVDNRKGLISNTGPYGDLPLKIRFLKSGSLHARGDQKQAQSHNFMHLGHQMAKSRVDNRKGNYF